MHYVIIGNGIAGISAAQTIRTRDEKSQITIISEEYPYLYARTALMWAYMGQLLRRDMEPYERWYWKEMNFHLKQAKALSIDVKAQRLQLDNGSDLPYDRLLLATGSVPNKFGWPGQDLPGVCTFTSIGDLDRLESMQGQVSQAVVVGGGLIGIELVEILLNDGVEVTYLIREPWYFNLALSEPEAALVHNRLVAHGCTVIYNDEIAEIQGDTQGVSAVLTKQGKKLPCQLVGLAVGVHPRKDLAESAGINCGRGIQVNPSMQTSVQNVYSAGDCAEILFPHQERGLVQALWYTSLKQGRIAGRAMLGDPVSYDPGIPYNSAQFLFLDFITTGWTKVFKPELEEYQWVDKENEHAVRVSHDQDNIVKGFSMLGPRYDFRLLRQWIQEYRSVDYVLKNLPLASHNEEFRKVTYPEVN